METPKQRFVRIMREELRDLVGIIDMLCHNQEKLHQDGTTSNYVCQENLALYHGVIKLAQGYEVHLSQLNIDKFNDFEAVAAHLQNELTEKYATSPATELSVNMIRKRLDKVSAILRK